MDNTKPLAVIAQTSDVGKIQQMIANAKRKYGCDHPVVLAGLARLDELLGPGGAIAADYEAMRRVCIALTGNDGRLDTLRRNRGVIGALEYLMATPAPSKAFHKLVAGGREDETAEAIVVRHPEEFTPTAVAAAHKRLEK